MNCITNFFSSDTICVVCTQMACKITKKNRTCSLNECENDYICNIFSYESA